MPVTFTFGEMLSARSVIGTTLAELGKTHDNLWVLTPDIGATLVEFQETFPDRFIDVGLAEQVCVGIAAGLAYDGNIPVVSGMTISLDMQITDLRITQSTSKREALDVAISLQHVPRSNLTALVGEAADIALAVATATAGSAPPPNPVPRTPGPPL